jgi:hypothetical protein
MAKAKETTETTETTETRAKAKAGTSLAARAKAAVIQLAQSFAENAEALKGITLVGMDEVNALAKEFISGSTKGLPLKVQLENTVKEMREMLQAGVVDGVLAFSDEQQDKYETLAAKAKRLRAAIEKENKPAENSANSPTE